MIDKSQAKVTKKTLNNKIRDENRIIAAEIDHCGFVWIFCIPFGST